MSLRDASAITVLTPDQLAILAAANFEAIPPLPISELLPPAYFSISWFTSIISSIREALESILGSAVKRPGVSVNKTNKSASTKCATSAAILSLSPKRISSSAIASFSFTTGTTSKSIRVVSVFRACKYWERTKKSSGASKTCPANRP